MKLLVKELRQFFEAVNTINEFCNEELSERISNDEDYVVERLENAAKQLCAFRDKVEGSLSKQYMKLELEEEP